MIAPSDSSTFLVSMKTKILVFVIICAIILSFAFASISKSKPASNSRSIKAETVRLSEQPNDAQNPGGGYLFCENPIFTLALMIDRSGSVSGESENEGQYKESIKIFLDDLHRELVESRNGKVDVIMFAFGSRSVIQNPTTSTNEIVTSISDRDSLEIMKTAVDRIFFTKNSWSDDAESLVKNIDNPYDVARSYNAGDVSKDEHQMMGYTNWDDAFQSVANIGKTPAYSSPDRGKHIDLALMLTDGMPNVNNDENRTFEVSDVADSDHSNRQYLVDGISELRTGIPGVRPPMDTRGLLINSTADADMDAVFGTGSKNWTKATNFKDDLQDVLDALIDSIETDEECNWIPVYPKIKVSFLASSNTGPGNTFIQREASDNSDWLQVEICNETEHLPLKDPQWNITPKSVTTRPAWGMPYTPLTLQNELAPKGQPGSCASFKAFVGDVELGEGSDGDYKLWSWGEVTPTKKYRIAKDSPIQVTPGDDSAIPENNFELKIRIDRIEMPA